MAGKTRFIYLLLAVALLLPLRWLLSPRSGLNENEPGKRGEILPLPVAIPPTWTRAEVPGSQLPQQEWKAVTLKFYPNRTFPTVSNLLHQLENWGAEAHFPKSSKALSGPEMMSLLFSGTSDPLFHPKSPLFYRDEKGQPRISRFEDKDSESHPYQVLATCAALGMPSARILRAGSESATIAEFVQSLRNDFHLDGEVEWAAIALACYAPTRQAWSNARGRSFDFRAIAESLLSRPFGRGSCAGIHVLEALTVMLRVDSVHGLFSVEVRERIERHLGQAIQRLEAHQRRSGYWAPDWAVALADPSTERFDLDIFPRSRLVLATGHHLEWLQLLPSEQAISSTVRNRAIKWCISELQKVPTIPAEDFCPYSHCFRLAQRYAAPQNPTPRKGSDL